MAHSRVNYWEDPSNPDMMYDAAQRKESERISQSLKEAEAQVAKEKAATQAHYHAQATKRKEERAAEAARGPQPATTKTLTMLFTLNPLDRLGLPSEDEIFKLVQKGTMWPALLKELEHPTAASHHMFSMSYVLNKVLDFDLSATHSPEQSDAEFKASHGEVMAKLAMKLNERGYYKVDEFHIESGAHSIEWIQRGMDMFPEHQQDFAKAVNGFNMKTSNNFLIWSPYKVKDMFWGDIVDPTEYATVYDSLKASNINVKVSIGMVRLIHLSVGLDSKPSPYIYITSKPAVDTKDRYAKLKVLRHEERPAWTETVTFNSPIDQPLFLHVWDSHLLGHNKCLGTVEIDLRIPYLLSKKGKSSINIYKKIDPRDMKHGIAHAVCTLQVESL